MDNLHNPLNPFVPTVRDIDRTEELTKKNYFAVGLLGFIISPIASAVYLNRAVNSLKIFAYASALTIILCLGASDEEEAFGIGAGIGFIANIVIMTEQFIAVSNARKRQSLKKGTLA